MNFPKNYIVFDFETTGLHPVQNDILEIAAMKIGPNGIDEFQRLIKRDVPVKITEITGITQKDSDGGVHWKAAIADFLNFIDHGTIPMIGHNIFKFDLLFLFAAMQDFRKETKYLQPGFESCIEGRAVDTAAIFKAREMKMVQEWHERHYEFAKRVLNIYAPGVFFNVGFCCDKLQIDRSKITQHRAMGDVILTNEIYKELCLK